MGRGFFTAMYTVCYQVTAVHHSMPDDLLIRLNEATVEGLARVNRVWLDYYNVPSLYQFAPRYHVPAAVASGRERERWKDIPTVITERWGDCKDFVAWRLAELWKAGIDARARSIVQRRGRQLLFHTYVEYADGRTEDPARTLGMP